MPPLVFDLTREARSISASVMGAASTMRLAAAAPVNSATARRAPAQATMQDRPTPPGHWRGECPPPPPRIFAIRSGIGQCEKHRRETVSLSFCPPAISAHRFAIARTSSARARPVAAKIRRDDAVNRRRHRQDRAPVRTAAMLAAITAASICRGIDHHAREPRRQRQSRASRPSSVMRPWRSIAPSSVSNSLASRERRLWRRIEKRKFRRIDAPHSARSRTKDDRSADNISGRV